ncbi:hypothetical protein WH47_05502 [Habropoda laboriosa]|uniref:Uncharacterized protein n=1 Tax=Habropoda laboriosa TaxID=597456 RepID=A0A0L7RFG4_9HYME|nr:hypothetical protein WH47_05502 [Habropoda laboriosa]
MRMPSTLYLVEITETYNSEYITECIMRIYMYSYNIHIGKCGIISRAPTTTNVARIIRIRRSGNYAGIGLHRRQWV